MYISPKILFALAGSVIVAIAAICIGIYVLLSNPKQSAETSETLQPTATTTTAATLTPTPSPTPDSVSTLETPRQITTSDGKQFFYYGAPAGHNNTSPKKIIISLPGHGTRAEDDYAAWLPHLREGSYALASLNWWDGNGETKANYYTPSQVQAQTKAFLTAQGYADSDIVILEGFSRGSANTYAVIANDKSRGKIFDAVISASGGYQSDFPLFENQSNTNISTTLFDETPWVLVCGGADPTPECDGCPGMETTHTFLTDHGADVLTVLSDPNASHGAFHKSNLGLPAQALELIENALGL